MAVRYCEECRERPCTWHLEPCQIETVMHRRCQCGGPLDA